MRPMIGISYDMIFDFIVIVVFFRFIYKMSKANNTKKNYENKIFELEKRIKTLEDKTKNIK